MPAKKEAAGFLDLSALLAEEKQAAAEFIRLTGAMYDLLLTGEYEALEALLNERQSFISRTDELKARADLLYLELRGGLSSEGLAVFYARKDEVAKLWQEARQQDKVVAEKMHALLLELRQKLSDVSSSKKGLMAYAASNRPDIARALDDKF